MSVVLSKRERKFLQAVIDGDLSGYTENYRRVLKKRILDKHKQMTSDSAFIAQALDRLQAL